MKHTLKHIFFTILVTAVLYSQVGVLMYEVYCHCKKEFSYHLHMAVSDCSISEEIAPAAQSCCSIASKCSKPEQNNKPCSEKEIKLLKLEAAKTNAESNQQELDNYQLALESFMPSELKKSIFFNCIIKANAPPDFNYPRSAFEINTLPFIQSFLC